VSHSRRQFIRAISLGILATHVTASAQESRRMPRLARLFPLGVSATAHTENAFRQGLRELGWVEGQNVAFEDRFADGEIHRLPALAAELVRLKVDVILAGSVSGALAVKNATTTIPVVFLTGGDPVASGLVGSLARPGGNLTGVTALTQELSAKRMELLKEALPAVTRVAFLSDPAYPDDRPALEGVGRAARASEVQLIVLEVRDPSELETAFARLSSERVGALLVGNAVMFNQHRRRIVELAAKSRVPAIYGLREYADAGGLMFYGASLQHMYYRSAAFVHRILKGAKPGDLPIEQASKFDLLINLNTARTLGITIPQAVLIRADRVIE
jgi:ABC-type uncharacterized transport system substrate-binding protein